MRRIVTFIGCFLVLSLGAGLVSAVIPQSAKAAGAAPVNVVNTVDNPVPVTGNVSATVTGNVNATISGEVNLAPGTLVNIGNSAASPVFVREIQETKQPVHGSAGCFFNGGSCLIDLTTVPSGDRLVIEHISGNIQMILSQHVSAAVVGRALSACCLSSVDDFLAPQVLAGTEVSQLNHQTLMFFNGGDTVRVLLGKETSAPGGAANFSYSGYLMPN